MEEWKVKLFVDLENKLDDLILNWEGFESLTPEDINEYYGYLSDCQIAEKFCELKEYEKLPSSNPSPPI